MLTKVSLSAAVVAASATMGASSMEAVTPNGPVAVAPSTTCAMASLPTTSTAATAVAAPTVVRFAKPSPKRWTVYLQRQFNALVVKEAVGTITAEESLKLEQLQQWREHALPSRSPEQLLRDYVRQRKTQMLLEALRAYEQDGEDPARATWARPARPDSQA